MAQKQVTTLWRRGKGVFAKAGGSLVAKGQGKTKKGNTKPKKISGGGEVGERGASWDQQSQGNTRDNSEGEATGKRI